MRNRDAADSYVHALTNAGFAEVKDMEKSDFLLYDYERGSGGKRAVMEEYLKQKPGFIYPHTPLSYFIWDGAYDPLPVQCNFVAGNAAVESMKAYGYPYRVEACGFPRCTVREFEPTHGTKVLFVPARTRKDGGYASKEYAEMTPQVFKMLLRNVHRFEQFDMCYTGTFETVGIQDMVEEAIEKGVKFHLTNPYRDRDPMGAMIKHILAADLIISCETVGSMAVALGKPTIFYNANATPTTLAGASKHFESYRKHYSFPLTAEEMTIDEILAECKTQNPKVEAWKRRNIGGQFDADKFPKTVKEYI